MRTLLLLDLDGTLIDTPHYEAWRYAARRIGIEDLTYEEYVIYIAGRPRLDGASRLMELKKNCARVDTRWLHDLAEIKQLEFLRLSVNIEAACQILYGISECARSVRRCIAQIRKIAQPTNRGAATARSDARRVVPVSRGRTCLRCGHAHRRCSTRCRCGLQSRDPSLSDPPQRIPSDGY
jgi:beta-phosphoglucomutase-like phosphatase (HAD superfamily)